MQIKNPMLYFTPFTNLYITVTHIIPFCSPVLRDVSLCNKTNAQKKQQIYHNGKNVETHTRNFILFARIYPLKGMHCCKYTLNI